jgi:hypothetical protein
MGASVYLDIRRHLREAALVVVVLAVSGAIFLILELDQPFGGLIQISSEPMLNALGHLAK